MYQIKLTSIFAFLVFLLTSCKKQMEEKVVLPSAEASLTRNLVFTNQINLEKNVSYGVSKIKPMASIEDGQLVLHFTTASNVPGTADESVSLYINASHVNSNLAKGYTFGTAEPALKRVYYTYSFTENATSTWGSITDSKLGVVFEGLLNITSYDVKNKLISGAFNVKARRLINDPTVKSIATPVDPVSQCDLTLTGTFSNVKLQ